MIHNQHEDKIMFAHEYFVVFCNHKNKHLKPSIKLILNNTATGSAVTRNQFNETIKTGLFELFLAVKAR